jgi:2-polyprenyl-3-methyl-5-hydroxy-6-metoxy-1,4-benzoquinol methylase
MKYSNKNEWIQVAKFAKRINRNALLENICNGKNVLDVGCVGQDVQITNRNWLHQKILTVSNYAKGVDIDRINVLKMKKKGYDIVCPEELCREDKFDVIVMADVIEHVDNPVLFLEEYSTYLNKKGVIIVTTPNSNRALNFLSILFYNDYSINDEHTMWLCPKTLFEIISRVQILEVRDFYWLDNYGSSSFDVELTNLDQFG